MVERFGAFLNDETAGAEGAELDDMDIDDDDDTTDDSEEEDKEVSFDENGDITNRVISVFQIHKEDKFPLDDVLHQYKYMGVAPQSS